MSSVSYLAEIQSPGDRDFPQVVTCEDILRILLEAYTLASDPDQEFMCKERELQLLYKRYQCLFDEYSPLFFQFVKNAYGYQILIIIGKIQSWQVNLVAYETPAGWVVLPGSPFGRCGDSCNKFQYTVTKARLNQVDLDRYHKRKSVINDMINNCAFDYGPYTLIDYRTKPCIQIVEPCNKAKVSCQFWFRVSTVNWRLQDHGKNYRLYIDGCEHETVYTDEAILIRLTDTCKGWKKLSVKLFDECGRYARVKQSIWVELCTPCDCKGCKKCCDSSSSSSDCSSSSSSKCCDSSSSSDCSSSSSSKCCDSSSSSKCCSSSSSSKCCSSSSSSKCCDSSSSSSSSCCKKKKKHHHKKKCCSSSSSSDCSSSSSSSCSSSSSSSDDEPCTDSSREGAAYYNFQQSFTSEESSSSSAMVVKCGDGCDAKNVVCQKRGVKCPKLACGNIHAKN